MYRAKEIYRKFGPGLKKAGWETFQRLIDPYDQDFIYDNLDKIILTLHQSTENRSGWFGKNKKWSGEINEIDWWLFSPKAKVGLLINQFAKILDESDDGPYTVQGTFREEIKVLAETQEAIKRGFPAFELKNHPNGRYEKKRI